MFLCACGYIRNARNQLINIKLSDINHNTRNYTLCAGTNYATALTLE